jgi:hypothetical protein
MAQKWQYRRVQKVILDGIVLQSAGVGQMAREYPRRNNTIEHCDGVVEPEKTAKISVAEDEDPNIPAKEDDAGAVVFLFPPKGDLPWSFSSMWHACKLWLLETFNPVKDISCNDEVRDSDFSVKDDAVADSEF